MSNYIFLIFKIFNLIHNFSKTLQKYITFSKLIQNQTSLSETIFLGSHTKKIVVQKFNKYIYLLFEKRINTLVAIFLINHEGHIYIYKLITSIDLDNRSRSLHTPHAVTLILLDLNFISTIISQPYLLLNVACATRFIS